MSDSKSQETDRLKVFDIPETTSSLYGSFASSFIDSNFGSPLSIAINICLILAVFGIAFVFSVSLGIFLFAGYLCFLVVRWLASTDMNVEITNIIAKLFFPPSVQNYWNTKTTPELAWTSIFRDNYKVVYQELMEYLEKYHYAPQLDDGYAKCSIVNWDRKWATVTLRMYGLDTKTSGYFPRTMAMVNNAKDAEISQVMFSILKPFKFIPRHRGPYRGIFRYALGLEIPPCNDPENGLYLSVWPGTSKLEFCHPAKVPKCDPTVITWTNGDDFVFDDTCVHEVHNSTPFRRIVILMDISRFDLPWIGKTVHKLFMSVVKFIPTVKRVVEVQDKYINEDRTSKKVEKWDGVANENRILENDVDWKNIRPGLLPFRKARMKIASLEEGNVSKGGNNGASDKKE